MGLAAMHQGGWIYCKKWTETKEEQQNCSSALEILRSDLECLYQPSQTRRWSRLKPNCYGWRQKTKNLVEIEAYLKPSWVLTSTKIDECWYREDECWYGDDECRYRDD